MGKPPINQNEIDTDRLDRAAARAHAAQGWDWRGVAVWIAGVSAPLALGIGGFAHQTLWGHETRLATLEVQRKIDDVDTTAKREEIREELRNLNEKIDRLLERRP
jgi:hypothetical protein